MSTEKRKAFIWAGVILAAAVAFFLWVSHGNPSDKPIEVTMGRDPELGEPETETFPSVGLADDLGWEKGQAPVPAKGLAVNRFAEGLDHPRTMLTLPNGEKLTVDGFYSVDAEKLAGLSDAQALEFFRNGAMALIHAHQVSMRHMPKLVQWRGERTAAQAG